MPAGTSRTAARSGDGTVLHVGPASRQLRATLRPIEWAVLEDIALDARRDGTGRLVAPTSARRVAEHLCLTPGAAARAVARLRSAGLLTYAREVGPAGRFGLSTYVLGTVPGLEVVEPSDGRPCPLPSCPVRPRVDGPRALDAHMAPPPRSVGADSAPRSDAAAAPAAASDQLTAEDRARTTAGRAAAKRGRRPASKPVVAQLSILDATINELDSIQHPQL